jgi:Ca2+-binding EF-hand superfamily protein
MYDQDDDGFISKDELLSVLNLLIGANIRLVPSLLVNPA